MTVGPSNIRWRSPPVALGLMVGLAGLVVIGVLGGAVGFLAGVAAARRTRGVLVVAGLALFATAALTVFEQPLSEAGVHGFPDDHPLAEIAGAVAAALLLAGLAGILARRDHTAGRQMRSEKLRDAAPPVPISTIAAVLAVTLLAALALARLGDRRWEAAALVVAIAVLVLAAVLAAPRFRRRLRAGSP